MAEPKPKQILYSPVDVDDADFAQFEQEKTQEEIDFDQFRDEMRDADTYAKITVSRQPTDSKGRPIGKKLFQMFECGIDDYTFSQLIGRIRDDYGTGIYRIQGRGADGQFKFNKSIGVEAPKSDEPAGSPDSVGTLIDKFSDAMERQQARNEQMFRDFSRSANVTNNPMEMLTQMATAMATIMGQLGMNKDKPKTLMEQLTEYKMMQELFNSDGSGGGESNLFSLLTETVKSFGPALGMAIATQQESGAIPMSGPIQPVLPQPQPEQKPLSEQLESMRPQIEFLLAQAKQGATPDAVATAILPGIPDQALESIETFLQQENCLDLCAQVNAEVNQWRQWFTEWRQIMLNALSEILTDDSEPGDGEIIGGEVLTTPVDQEQDGGAVAGDLQEPDISATAESESTTSDVDGVAVGDGGDAANS